ncbi:hypothetical protein A3224_12710 [Microbulbifer thermotolerans]|uniref:Uncharacterized protein n=1 Tax=Microbulbifer thermotolerans TaxID=252514 RepID=A0A143HNL1_MICTH|nr:hypothetical protein A3224_12710 [Microbulbifer thermotolerans]
MLHRSGNIALQSFHITVRKPLQICTEIRMVMLPIVFAMVKRFGLPPVVVRGEQIIQLAEPLRETI